MKCQKMKMTATLRPLYLAKNMNELNALISTNANFKLKSTSLLVAAVNMMYQNAETSILERDEEKAYTCFMRFLDLILILKDRSEFIKEKEFKAIMEQVNHAVMKAEYLKNSLMKRYPKREVDLDVKVKNDVNHNMNEVVAINISKTDVEAVAQDSLNNQEVQIGKEMTTIKPLYLAKNMDELNSLISTNANFKLKSTSTLVASANKIYQNAETSILERDEEKAYTCFMRFVDLILILKDRSEFIKKKEYKAIMEQANHAVVEAEYLKNCLLKRYFKREADPVKVKHDINHIMNEVTPINNLKTDVEAAAVDIPNNGKVQISKGQTFTECVICFEESVNCALYRCGHMCMCYKCARQMWNPHSKCPLCRETIEDIIKVYI